MGVGYKRLLTREESSIIKISCQISWGVVLSSPRLFSTNIACTGMQCNAALFSPYKGNQWHRHHPACSLEPNRIPCDALKASTRRPNWGNKPLGIPSIIRSQMPAPQNHTGPTAPGLKDWWAWQPNQLVWHLHLGGKEPKRINQPPAMPVENWRLEY